MSTQWELTPDSFDRLLLALDPDRDRAAAEYEKLRFKITKLLEWRGCRAPEEFADRVFDRLARRIEAGEQIEHVYSFCCGIARMLLLEARRQEDRDAESLKQFSSLQPGESAGAGAAIPAKIFERCLEQLPQESRELVLNYYQEQKQAKIDRRRQLAESSGMPLNALRLRVQRIRTKLRQCVEQHRSKDPDTQ